MAIIFIEVCLDMENSLWFMLHSGSRGVGNRIGNYFISLAKKEMQKYFINLPDKDLSYIPENSLYFWDYFQALSWAQKYAKINREIMMARLIKAVEESLKIPFQIIDQAINCHHNYVTKEKHYSKDFWVTRKGAVRAQERGLGYHPRINGNKVLYCSGKRKQGFTYKLLSWSGEIDEQK